MGKTILTPQQIKVLDILSSDPEFQNNFYFTGGTVLAEYYLKHRLSEDLDFFSESDIDGIWITSLAKILKSKLKAEKTDLENSFNRNLLFITFEKEVLKTEFTYYPFTQIEKPKIINNLKIDSLLDIAVNKFFTIYQKPTARHFIDLYLIIKREKINWEKLAKLARIKFDTAIDNIQLGGQLVTASNISDLPKMLISLRDEDWRSFFLEKAMELKEKIAK